MNLRRKLFITFGTLVFLGLVVAGISIWATLQWESTSEQLQRHYMRSLEAQRVRAVTFEAFKEVPDALNTEDPNARQDFEDAVATVEGDLDAWADLAGTDEEEEQVREVRTSFDGLVLNARALFYLIDTGRQDQAAAVGEEWLEGEEFESFRAATEEAVASDREYREVVREQTESTRRTAQLVLILVAFGTVSLLLLVAAYLASDLFRPLRELRQALEDVEKGDSDRRLDEERADELGEINQAFNRMAETVSRREQMEGLASVPTDGNEEGAPVWRDTPSRVMLHHLVSQLRSRVVQLGEAENGRDAETVELADQLDQLSRRVAQMTEFGFPLDLNLSRTDVRALLYQVFLRFQDEFAERAAGIELHVAPEVGYVVADRLKLREAVGELLRNALAALPESGGQLGLRSRLSEKGTELLIEVADNGAGTEQSAMDGASYPDDRPRAELALAEAIVEQHGGRMEVMSDPGEGTYARILLPLQELRL